MKAAQVLKNSNKIQDSLGVTVGWWSVRNDVRKAWRFVRIKSILLYPKEIVGTTSSKSLKVTSK